MFDTRRWWPSSIPSPADTHLTDLFRPPWEEGAGVRSVLEARTPGTCEYYAAGKMALRDALDLLAREATGEKETVLLPAFVPSGVLEPIRAAGYTPIFYPITPSLRPVTEAVERELDRNSLALLTVNYFGFPQPAHDQLRRLADEVGATVIEDNAHAALSETPDGRLLGTRSDVGFTSFRKTMPVPDGGALFVQTSTGEHGAFPRAGVHQRVTMADVRLLGGRVLARRPTNGDEPSPVPPDRRPDDALEDGRDLFGRVPSDIYDQSKGKMSWLTAFLLDQLRADAIVASKRQRYRDRHRLVGSIDGVRAVYGALEAGICPQACPVVVKDWELLYQRLEIDRDAMHRWPPLPQEVATDDRYRTSQYLADHLVPLPV